MRFTSKQELIEAIEKEHLAFVTLASSVPRARYSDGGVWGDGWNLKDLFSHLTEWEQMFLDWYRTGCRGENPVMPAQGFKWSQTPELNRAIWRKHRHKSEERVIADFDASYDEVLSFTRDISPQELFTPGCFAWTNKTLLSTYLAANTCSHYHTAGKYLKRWLRGIEHN